MQHKQQLPSQLKMQPLYSQFWDLLLIELTNWRWSWRTAILMSVIAPLLSIVAFGVFARNAGKETIEYILTGNIVMGLTFDMMNKVQNHYMFIRKMGTIDYFATLPIKRPIFILAMLAAFLLLALPSFLITTILGSLYLGLPLSPNPLLIIVIPLCAIPLAGLGALIASYVRTPEDSNAISLLLTVILIGLGPVIIAPDRLPSILILLGHISPATYAASALRQTLLGPSTGQLVLDMGVLVLFSIVIFWFVGRKLVTED